MGGGTLLSLFGDATLYAVLPTHTLEAGVSVAGVGVLLSANRFVRLLLNGPAGIAYDRWRHRWLFVLSLFIGALSTAIYSLTRGFWPLLIGRLLWGLSWSGIWVGGNSIVLSVSREGSRGRWVGAYHASFFLGSSGGAVMGGLLTDWIGYHRTMGVGAGLTLLGALVALLSLPETGGGGGVDRTPRQPHSSRLRSLMTAGDGAFIAAVGLYGANRLALAGFLQSTFGLFLLERVGEGVRVGGRSVGVATLTGLGLGVLPLISVASAPILGGLSDRVGDRWRVVVGGLVPGVAGFGLLALGSPLATLLGIPLTAIAGGSNQGLATTLIGDLEGEGRRGQRLGVLFTVGDLASAVGPVLAYSLIPLMGIQGVYLLGAVVFALMLLVALRRAR